MSPLVLGAGKGVHRSIYRVLDNFVGSDVALSSHAPDRDLVGGGWLAGAGVFSLTGVGDVDQTTGGAAATNVYIETDISDCTIELVYKTGDGDDYGGIVFRATDGDSNMEFFINPAQNNTYVGKNVNGSRNTLSFTGMTLATATEYTLKVILLGTSIKAYVDGVLKIDINDATEQASTKHGIWMWTTDTFSRWDSFKVWK